MRLVIGNKNYSTWSLRPWMLLEAFGVSYEEQVVSLKSVGLTERLAQFSSSARVPVLQDGDLKIWDSLAICEYVNEQYLDGKGWPDKKKDRAYARALCAEMHSGFSALRSEMPMNCRATRYVELSSAAKEDIKQIDKIWSKHARVDEQGELRLFGQFSIADCFFAPVVMRFSTYQPDLSMLARAYAQSMRSHPSLKKWFDGALLETEIVEEDEAGVDI